MTNKINVLLVCPGPADTTSLYRGVGPFAALERDQENFHVTSIQSKNLDPSNWTAFQNAHVLVYQRPFRMEDAKIIEAAKCFGLRVIIDYDDDLFCVMRDNPVVALYSSEATKTALKESVRLADLVMTSTQALKDAFVKNTESDPRKFHVVRNGFDTRWFKHFWNHQPRLKRIVWRGSSTHRKDCEEIKEPFDKFMNEHTDYSLFCYGWTNDVLTYDLPHERFWAASMPVIDYHTHLHSIAGHIGIVPLVDNAFNRSKSNIGFIELVSSGHLCISKKLPEFESAGAVTYSTEDEFYNELTKYTMDASETMRVWKSQFEYLKHNLTLDAPNGLRLEIIKSLIG